MTRVIVGYVGLLKCNFFYEQEKFFDVDGSKKVVLDRHQILISSLKFEALSVNSGIWLRVGIIYCLRSRELWFTRKQKFWAIKTYGGTPV
jgi:hypothetical protein